MLCEQVMNRNVKSLNEKETVHAAAKLMRESQVGFLPICGAGGKVIGTLTDRDIVVRLTAESKPWTTVVSTLMSRDVVSCKPTDELRHLEQLMQHHRKSRVVCVDDSGRPVGVVSLSDVARHETDFHLSAVMRSITSREARTL